MRKFLATLAPVALMAVPVLFYRGQFDDLGARQEWVVHTFEARGLAFRIARNSGTPADPAKVGALIREFSGLTADNPAQVEAARRMGRALREHDLGDVAAAADRAVAEEERLLAERVDAYNRRMARLRQLADLVFAVGVFAILVREGVELLLRALPHPTPRLDP